MRSKFVIDLHLQKFSRYMNSVGKLSNFEMNKVMELKHVIILIKKKASKNIFHFGSFFQKAFTYNDIKYAKESMAII